MVFNNVEYLQSLRYQRIYSKLLPITDNITDYLVLITCTFPYLETSFQRIPENYTSGNNPVC